MKLVRYLIVMLLVAGSGFAQNRALSKPTGYVDDYAEVIAPETEADIDEICHEVHAKASAQIFLVTVKSLNGETIETYANDLFHQWKIGDKKTDRGILVLLAVSDHKRRIEVGYGLEGILPDAKAGAIGRDMVPALKAEDYGAAGKLAVREIAQVIADDAKVSLTSTSQTEGPAAEGQTSPPVTSAPTSDSLGNGASLIVAVLFSSLFGVFGLILWVFIRRARSGYASGPGFYNSGDRSSFSGFSGGDSGGSSSDSGSSGDSFSGGDGGDSGGGGASGDW